MNYDAALICTDRRSENELFAGLNSINLNVRTMSNMFERKVFSVMVKIRKNVKSRAEATDITRKRQKLPVTVKATEDFIDTIFANVFKKFEDINKIKF